MMEIAYQGNLDELMNIIPEFGGVDLPEIPIPQGIKFLCKGSHSIEINSIMTQDHYIFISGCEGVTIFNTKKDTWSIIDEYDSLIDGYLVIHIIYQDKSEEDLTLEKRIADWIVETVDEKPRCPEDVTMTEEEKWIDKHDNKIFYPVSRNDLESKISVFDWLVENIKYLCEEYGSLYRIYDCLSEPPSLWKIETPQGEHSFITYNTHCCNRILDY